MDWPLALGLAVVGYALFVAGWGFGRVAEQRRWARPARVIEVDWNRLRD
jgi:hypothetical protein